MGKDTQDYDKFACIKCRNLPRKLSKNGSIGPVHLFPCDIFGVNAQTHSMFTLNSLTHEYGIKIHI